ncbi:MAG TPA: DMT family transporter [Candidatus Rhabdochlamydia sp.]|jgi:drug/metabolite transporter (DMT)-like permease|nr:DMT family transporter [Candidatus Rhabdochlamydia sp.]
MSTAKSFDQNFMKGVAYILLSTIGISLFGLFSKFGLDDTPFFLITFLRFAIPFILLLPFSLAKYSVVQLWKATNWRIQWLRSGCVLVYQYSFFYFLNQQSLLDAAILQNTSPLFILIFESLFHRQRLNMITLFSIAISFIGVLCILQPDLGVISRISLVGFLIPVALAGSQVIYSHQVHHIPQQSTLFFLFFLCSIFTGVLYLFSGELFQVSNYGHTSSFVHLWILLGMGVTSIFNQSFRGFAYRYARPSILAPFSYVALLFSGLFDWLIFNRLPNLWSGLGLALIIIGSVIQFYGKKRFIS